MPRWEYCAVSVALYRSGSGGATQELLSIRLPGAPARDVTHALGVVGLLNQLGDDEWELVDVEGRTYFLKRERRRAGVRQPPGAGRSSSRRPSR